MYLILIKLLPLINFWPNLCYKDRCGHRSHFSNFSCSHHCYSSMMRWQLYCLVSYTSNMLFIELVTTLLFLKLILYIKFDPVLIKFVLAKLLKINSCWFCTLVKFILQLNNKCFHRKFIFNQRPLLLWYFSLKSFRNIFLVMCKRTNLATKDNILSAFLCEDMWCLFT